MPAPSGAFGVRIVFAAAQNFVGGKRSVPTTQVRLLKMVGTAQARLCPPYTTSSEIHPVRDRAVDDEVRARREGGGRARQEHRRIGDSCGVAMRPVGLRASAS